MKNWLSVGVQVSAKASDVRTVMVNGEILMRDRKLTRHDDAKLMADARQANGDLMERLSKLSS